MGDGIKAELTEKRGLTRLPHPTEFIFSDHQVEAHAFAYSLEPGELRAEVSFEAWLRCRHAGQPGDDRVRWEH